MFFSNHPFAADRPPGRIETAIARRLVVLSIPASVKRQSNPNPPNGDSWREGAEQFQEDCAFCHGTDGRAHSEVARKMYPPVPDLAEPVVQEMSDGAIFAIIQNGVRWTGMPAFGNDLSPDKTWKLVSFVRRTPRINPQDMRSFMKSREPSTPDNKQGTTISMDGTSFVPKEATVKVGETVTWINKDPFPHTVFSSAGHFHSQEIGPDQQWQFTPTTPGQFPYVCTLHPGMNGKLIVQNK
jgi:plastocyanin/mono/diheme cytochrome c family protein